MAMNPPINMKSSGRRDFANPIIQIVLLLVVLVLSSWFVVRPKIVATLEQRKLLKAAEQKMSKVEDEEKELNRLIKEIKSSPEDVALVEEALPLNGRASKAYVLLDNLIRLSGMSATLISANDTSDLLSAGDKDELVNPYKPDRELHTVFLTASVTGTMEQFRSLLQIIETNGRVLDVENVNILGGEAETKFRITVKAYSYEKL